ncbi:hypothetical protein GEMRC1_009316 [Eukaryota sp. GEM-RC1]
MFAKTAGLRDVSNTANVLGRLRLKPIPTYKPTEPVKERYDIDLPPAGDPLAAYVHDIYNYLRDFEQRTHPLCTFLDKQHDITPENRAVVVDWLVDVHVRFRSVPESLFTAVNYLDRFLSFKTVVRTKLQLVAYTALFLACKFEDVYTPRLKHWIKLVHPSILKPDLLRAERLMVATLQFDLAAPSAFTFLRRFTKIAEADVLIKYSAHYLIELALMDAEYIKYYPSLQAAAALSVCLQLYGRSPWSAGLESYSKYRVEDLTSAVCFYKKVLNQAKGLDKYSRTKKAIFNKYSSSSYNGIALRVQERLNQM